ncbi:MAG: hypothetical protein ABSE16_09255 [Verrucomicrobiota bacterium]|jgi:hypothetical protein
MKNIRIVCLFGAGFVVGALTVGLWFGGGGRHQTATPTLTHDALIQQAIGQLAQNKVRKDMLEMPVVRDAALVYFKIKPADNVEMLLDSHSGEQIFAKFAPISHPFLKEYMSN